MQSDGTADGTNFTLRDEIRAYWSARAETFDQSPGHEIFSEDERAAWHALIERHLGPGDGRNALDLASGTGVMSHLMDDLGYRVTGIDWSDIPGVDLALATKWYGSKTVKGVKYAFDPADPFCLEWLNHGKETGEFGALTGVDNFDDAPGITRAYRYHGEFRLWRPNKNEPVRPVGR